MPLSYPETLDYLYSRLPMYSRVGSAALKPGLGNIERLCAALGDPQHAFLSIHIAGTNGKGSTSHSLAAVFRHCGYRTGLYTSPHLVDFRERIRIDGEEIPEREVVEFVERHRSLIEEVEPSFFEITVAMAFAYFAERKVDVAIIETGLGGRLDSTNIVTPLLSVITNISLDHQDLLGDTRTAIAKEKAGIIKPGVPALVGERDDETERVFLERSLLCGSPLYFAEDHWALVRTGGEAGQYRAIDQQQRTIHELRTDLTGTYQQANLVTVLSAVSLLGQGGAYALPLGRAMEALGQVRALTGLRGRWDVWQERPLVVADVAHNTAGLQQVIAQWKAVRARRKFVLLGFVRDKDVSSALRLFDRDCGEFWFTNASIPRALEAETLAPGESTRW